MKHTRDNESESTEGENEPLAKVAKLQKSANHKNNQPSCSTSNQPSTEDQQSTEDPDDEIDHISDDEEGGIRIGDIYIPPAPKPTLSMESTGPRLIITQIVNHNFKSYAGTQVLGPFHKSFSAIIGPNGSGKSNVIDSMLFVFGYRASKIRSKKISVLLHSSRKFPNITSCSVAVHFGQIIDKEGDEFEIVPNSKIVISRTAFKDNSSYYTLNDKKVQFKEVAKFLKSYGIDLDHNRFLILQGEVEQIAMMKPKSTNGHETGMLEYLEDIVGTSRFKDPIEKLFIRVEELSEARKEKLNRVRLVEAEKQKLEGPMKEAMEQLNLFNNLTRAKNTLYQKYVQANNKKIQHIEEDRNKQQNALEELDNQMKEVKAKKDESTALLAERNKKYENIEKQKEECSEALKKMKTRDVTLQADSTQMSKRKKNIEGVLEQEKSKLLDFQQVPEKSRRDIEDCDKLSAKLTKQKEKLEVEIQKVMATVRNETQGLHEQKDKVQSKLIELKKVSDEAKKNFKVAESQLKIYLSTEESEKKKLNDLKQTLEDGTNGVHEKKETLKQLEKSLPSKEKALRNAKTESIALKEEEKKLGDRIRFLRNQLEESRSSMNANKYRGVLLKSLMGEKRKGVLPGIFGRLGDLGGIDEKYDVAISTCCGPLDNIVVDKANTAQQCIEFLKRNDIGRATFIAAEKQEHLKQYYSVPKKYPENAPRLFDLVRVSDERVKPVFYFALHDTLVAKDMDQALRISFQGNTRYRVVTLGGEVCEVVGTMSGGGSKVIRGRIGTSAQVENTVDPNIIKKQEDELGNLMERLKEVQVRIEELDKQINSLMRECTDLKIQKDKVEVEYRSFVEQTPALKNKIKEQTEKVRKCAVDPNQKSAMERKTKDLELLLEKANLDASKVEKEVAVIHDKIVEIGGGKLKTMQTEINDLDKRIDKVRNEVTRLNVAIKTNERNEKKTKEKVDQMEREIESLVEKLGNIKDEKKKITIEAAETQKKLEQFEEQLSDKSSEFSDLKETITKLTKQENKLKGDRLELVAALSKFDKSFDELNAKIAGWKREIRSLTLETVEIPGHEPPPPLAEHSPEELDGYKIDDLQNRVHIQEERMGEHKPNLQAIQDYKVKEDLYLKRANELEEITNKRNEARALHDQLRKKRHAEFLAGFYTITNKLKEMYQMITLGGDAELELVDSLDPFTEGILFSVRPPNKSWKVISNLSGGEKTLSSLALVFALHYYKPTPLYVMDEIDAALDFKNVSIVANYINERTKNAQFIIISLRYNMFELSNQLVGIYKVEDCTRCLTVGNTPSLTVQDCNENPYGRNL